MKILALLGSPRKNGNSDILSEEFINGAKENGSEARKVYLDDDHMKPIGEVIDNSRKREDKRKRYLRGGNIGSRIRRKIIFTKTAGTSFPVWIRRICL